VRSFLIYISIFITENKSPADIILEHKETQQAKLPDGLASSDKYFVKQPQSTTSNLPGNA